MIEAPQISDLADLSEAAYVNFDPVPPGGWSGDALKDQLAKESSAWPIARRDEFVEHWRVVAHQPNADSGFSGTVFERIDPEPGETRYAVALRGTEGNVASQFFPDLASADLSDLVANGLAWHQILDMYNWWHAVTTSRDSTYEVVSAVALTRDVGLARLALGFSDVIVGAFGSWQIVHGRSAANGLGLLSPTERVDVTGHSLGGNIATAFSRLFTENTSNVVTINGAGYSVLGVAFGNIDRLFLTLGGQSAFDANRILNLYGDRGLNVVTQDFGLRQPGGHLPVFIETSLGSTLGHGAGQMAHSLRLYEMLRDLEGTNGPTTPSSMLSRYRPIFDAASNNDDLTFERVVQSLRQLLIGSAETAIGEGDLAALYERLGTLTDNLAYESLLGRVRIDRSTRDLRAKARNDFSALASLVSLSPLVLTGLDGALDAVLRSTRSGDYSNWQADKEMSPAEREAGAETFTTRWIDDRASLLDWMLLRNDKNLPGVVTAALAGRPISEAVNYEDKGSSLQILVGAADQLNQRRQIVFGGDSDDPLLGYGRNDDLYGGAGVDVLRGQGGNDYLEGNDDSDELFGGDGNDTLLGGAGNDSVISGEAGDDSLMGGAGKDSLDGGIDNDILYGGVGDDSLDGGTGNDILYGGADTDTYTFASGWGKDTIEDSDGLGSIQVTGYGTLTGTNATKEGDNEWTSADGKVKFTVSTSATTSVLQITFLGADGKPIPDSIRVNNWSSGNLGITLGGTVAPPLTDRTDVGDFAKLIQNGFYVVRDHNYVDAGPVASADDVITSGGQADLMRGNNGNDALAGLDGDDALYGGDGDDFLLGGPGKDTLEGGAGNDVIVGSGAGALAVPSDPGAAPPAADGPEISRGFSWVWWKNVGVDANGFETIQGRGGDYTTLYDDPNLIDGGAGDDWLYGATGEDTIYGGDGNDAISGSAGQDTLFGDAGNDIITGDGPATLGYVDSVPAPDQADDLLIGGAGRDTLSGDGGDDELYGGDDDDTLYGDSTNPKETPFASNGDDYLDGGAGNDDLSGNGGDDELIGGVGKDRMFGDGSLNLLDGQYHGDDYLDGGDGDDTLEGGGGVDTLVGGAGDDSLIGDVSGPGLKSAEYGDDYLDGEDGADSLFGGGKSDTLYGGEGDDALVGDGTLSDMDIADEGADYLDGGRGNDTLFGDGKGDTLIGGEGDDALVGDNDVLAIADHGDDFLDGGSGADTLDGNGGNDFLDGGEGIDNLFGSAGNDYLDGSSGDDYLDGGAGDDTLRGGSGTDILRGGAGNDTYIVAAGDSPLGTIGQSEAIVDNQGKNTIVFEGVGSSGTRVAGDDSGTLQVSVADGQSIIIQNGVAGNVGTFQYGDGRSLSYSELIGTFSETALQTVDDAGSAHHMGGRNGDALGYTSGGSVVSGGRGNDTLTGSGGNNTVLYSRGDGADLLTDSSAKTDSSGNPTPNRIVFGATIAASDLRLTGAAGALRIQIGDDPQDSITLGSFDQGSAGAAAPIDTFEFADGTVLSYAELVARGFHGDDGDDILSATAGNDILDGGAGDDVVFGQDGNDTLTGGLGNDTLTGGAGNDRYVFAVGDGQDVIDNSDSGAGSVDVLFLAGLVPGDVLLFASGSDLQVQVRGSTDQLTVVDHFSGASALDRIEFGDGTLWTQDDIFAHLAVSLTEGPDNVTGTNVDDVILSLGGNDTVRALGGADQVDGGSGNDSLLGGDGNDTLLGGSGNDSLQGDDGNDSLEGGAGDDQLVGGTGDDTFVFGRGDGRDTVYSSDTQLGKTDSVVFRPGIAPSDVLVARAGNDVILTIAGTADSLTLKSYLDNEGETPSRIEAIRFVDGTVWNLDAVKTRLLQGTSGNDILYGFDRRDDVIDAKDGADNASGYGGNDTIFGGAGNDYYLDGGAGDDYIDGGSGVDTLIGGAGNNTLVDGETMSAGTGNDTYVLTSITAPVQIDDAGGSADVLALPSSASAATARVDVGVNSGTGSFDYLDLRIGGGIVLLSHYFNSPDGPEKLEQIKFGDGTTWTAADVLARLPINNLSEGDDRATGFRWNDSISALGGDDYIYASAGDDVVDGGSGDDTLYGSVGNDTLFGAVGEDVLIGEDGNDSLLGGSGKDTLDGGSGADVLDGGAGDDFLYGGAGDDTLAGGAGRDYLRGEAGNDTYRLSRTSGHDRILEEGGVDRVVFDADVSVGDVTLFRDGDDLLVAIAAEMAQARVVGWFSPSAWQIERFEFSDGTVWGASEVVARTIAGTPNAMFGTAGNDNFVVDDPGDTIAETPNGGIDTVLSSVSYTLGANLENLTLSGYADINATGNGLDNVLRGNAGNNVLDGGGSLVGDTLIGGAGDDTYRGASAIIEELDGGIDELLTDFGGTLPANVENMTAATIYGGPGFDVRLVGNDLDNVITARTSTTILGGFGHLNDTINGGLGADTMISGAFNDSFYVDNVGDLIVAEQARVFSSIDWTLASGHLDLTLVGSSAVSATGNSTGNLIDGSRNAAANVLKGGAGDDIYRVGAGDRVVEAAGEGDDTVELSYRPSDGVFRTDAFDTASIEHFVVQVGLGSGLTVIGSERSEEIAVGTDLFSDIRSENDTLFGFGGDDSLRGASGNDRLDGGDGDDLLIAGDYFSGGDTLIGGSGDDVLIGGHASRGDVLDGGTGADLLEGDGNNNVYLFARGDGHDTIVAASDLTPVVDNVVRFAANVASRDVIVSQVGDDLYLGLPSSGDRIVVHSFFFENNPSSSHNPIQRVEFADGTNWGLGVLRDKANPNLPNSSPVLTLPIPDIARREGELVDFTIAAGTFVDPDIGDALSYSATLADGRALPPWLSLDAATGRFSGAASVPGTFSVRATATDYAGLDVSDAFDIVVSSENQLLVGTASSDTLVGRSGNDTLIGLAGDDVLDGGAGNDSMDGGTGNDFYMVDSAGDVVVENPGEGADAISSSVSYALPANVESLFLVGTAGNLSATGNNDANRIQGTPGNDRLDGGAGADTLNGVGGSDTFVVDDPGDVISAGTASGTYSVVESSISWTLQSGLQELRLLGSAALSATGNFSDNRLVGNSGDNRLDGGGGDDTMIGADGNDVYVADSSLDVVVELVGGGIDAVETAAFSWTLGANIENLKLTGGSALFGGGSGFGNELANVIIGTAWNDHIDGKGGADTLVGGAGDDRYVVDDAGDVVTELAGGGTDQVDSSASFTLAPQVENLVLLGSAGLDGTGNSLANSLTGNSGANRLDGGIGADAMTGQLGDDTYVVDDVGDRIIEQANGGFDTVESSISWTLAAETERLVLTGSANVNGTGNSGNNVVVGNGGANRLDGAAGADTMTGGAGDDTYVVDNVGDTTVELAGGGVDTIESLVSWTLASDTENLRLIGTADTSASGNAGSNVLTGNSGANVISAGAGNDTLDGGAGNDVLDGGAGDDTYLFDRGYGADTIDSSDTNTAKSDTLQLGAGVAVADLLLNREVDDLTVAIRGTSDIVRIRNHFTGNSASGKQIDQIRFANGTVWDVAAIQAFLSANHAPAVANPLAPRTIAKGDPFNFTVPVRAFVDQDSGDSLTYAATRADGTALPAWLAFDAVTRRLSGSSAGAEIGAISIKVAATDRGGLTASSSFDLNIQAAGGGQFYFGTPSADVLFAGSTNDTIIGGAGDDLLIGGVGDNLLYGDAGNDNLFGGDGIDTMYGGSGDDYYLVDSVDDLVGENFNEGFDTVQTSVDYALGDNLERLYLLNGASLGTGNALDNEILTNVAVLNGVTIDGGVGADRMTGSFGNDTYIVDNAFDAVFEFASFTDAAGTHVNDSIDTARASVTYSLVNRTGIEDLVLTGSSAIDGTGNALNNNLTGNIAANRLDGGAGNDTLDGAAGNDTYVFGRGYGADTIASLDTALGKIDTLQLLTGLAVADISLSREIDDLLVSIRGTSDSIRVHNHFAGNSATGNQIDRIRFANGVIWDVATIQGLVIANHAPTLALSLADQAIVKGESYSFTVPATAFADPDAGDVLTYSALQSNDAALPAWLIFNGQSFSGNSASASVGLISVRVTATDSGGLSASDIFDLTVQPPPDGDLITGTAGDDTLDCGPGNDTVYAGAGNDLVRGSPGRNLLHGEDGSDTLIGGGGADTMVGGTGDDTYDVDGLDDVVVELANEGTDIVRAAIDYTLGNDVENLVLGGAAANATGNALRNAITGNSATNRIDGAAGVDTMTGGAGDDAYVVDNLGDVVVELSGEGVDVVESSISWDLGAEIESLTLTGTSVVNGTGNSSDNRLTGNGAANALAGGSGNDTLDGAGGDDALDGGAGSDTYVFGRDSGNDTIASLDLSAGKTDTLQLSAGILVGDVLLTRAVNDLVLAMRGSSDSVRVRDHFAGNSAAGHQIDRMRFADGTSWDVATIRSVTNLSPVVVEPLIDRNVVQGSALAYVVPATTFSDPDIDDVLAYSAALADGTALPAWMSFDAATRTFTGNSASASPGLLSIRVTAADSHGLSASDVFDLTVQPPPDGYVITGTPGDDVLRAGSTNDTLYGGAGDDTLYGGTGRNAIYGDEGNDFLYGGGGRDTLIGGIGDDTYEIDSADDVVLEVAGEGVDSVQSSVGFALGADVENLTLTGTAAIDATGNTAANVLKGNAAANSLDGQGGADTLVGAAGDDTYIVDDAGDLVVENAGEGMDSVRAGVTYALGANVEALVLTGTVAIDGTGNTLDNLLVGNAASNRLVGNAGNDTLSGAGGADTLIGGAGDDTYRIDAPSATIVEAAGEGTDTVEASIGYALAANVERLTLTGVAAIGGTGNALANVIIGNAGSNRIDGGTGADTMAGGSGDDTYVVDNIGDVVSELAGEGVDTVETRLAHVLGVNVENLVLTGTSAVNGTGNALANQLVGNSAANVLDAGAGIDTMIGGLGNDTYVVDDAADVVVEDTAAGTELVRSGVSYSLSANVENLTLTGSTASDGTGNALANTLTGNAADNVLDGGAGADKMVGGLGNDTYVVDDAGDVVTEAASAGLDTVQARIDWTIGANVENLMLVGAAALKGVGNTLANVITGNAGMNRIDGGAGADTMSGGDGDDSYVVDNAGDVVVEAPGEGVDTIEIRLSWTLGTEIENLTLTGTGNVNGIGNALDNVLTGTSGANRLDGGAGLDTLIGGAGNDTYVLDSTGDVVVEAAGGGTDAVLASVSYALIAEVENLTLTGTGAIDGSGNAANNVIVGNASNNRLDGGIGADSMTGGLGDDTYVVDDAGDKTVEAASGGNDSVESSISWTLASQLENLVLAGEAAINATGNTAGNRLTGNIAANVLNGGGGADTMLGGMGDDVYVVDNVADVVVETADAGTDVVQSAVTWTLGADVENLLLKGTKAISATGNALDNVLVGNGAANVIRGDAGNDRLDGGAGADMLAGGLGNDTYVLGRGNGAELVQENDVTAANTDVLAFLSGISNDQIWFRHVGNDLQVSIIGTSDKATLQNWYLGSQYHVEQLKTSDGKSLLESRVESLVSAMAAFALPAVGQTTLPASYSALVPVISANWEEPVAVTGLRDDGQAASLSMAEPALAELAMVGPSEAILEATLEDLAPWVGRSTGRFRLLPDVDPTMDVALRVQASNLVEAMATFSAASDVVMGVPPVPAFHAMPIAVSPLTL